MRRIVRYILICLILALAFALSANAGLKYFKAQHWITGTVENAGDGQPADGREVRISSHLDPSTFESGVIGPAGPAAESNKYMLNAFNLESAVFTWEAGMTLEVESPLEADTYVAGPVTVETTDAGFDVVEVMTLESLGSAPRIYNVRFDGMLYNPYPGVPNIVQPKPKLTMNVTVEEAGGFVTSIEVSAGGEGLFAGSSESWCLTSEITFEYDFADELVAGATSIRVRAWSNFDTFGQRDFAVEVMGKGKAEVIGQPLVYPSPFRPMHGERATIAYNLTNNASTTLYVYDISGQIVWTRKFGSGSNGGRLGYNGVIWDGRSDFGFVVPNGMYVFMVISDRNRHMATGKLVVLD